MKNFLIFMITATFFIVVFLIFRESPIEMISWLLTGLWVITTIGFLAKIRALGEYKSPHNLISLIYGSLLIGTLYVVWGDFTTILTLPIYESEYFSLSLWNLVFPTFYLLYGIINLISVYRKFVFVYVGTKSFDARKAGIFISFIVCVYDIYYLLVSADVLNLPLVPFEPFLSLPGGNSGLNWFVLIPAVLIFLITLILGLSKGRSSSSGISRGAASRRLDDIDHSINRARRLESDARSSERAARDRQRKQDEANRRARERQRQAKSSRSSISSSRSSSRSSNSRGAPSRSSGSSRTRTSSSTRTQSSKIVHSKGQSLAAYRPKTGILSKEDFKCIFCFDLPTSTKDKSQNIVVCPKCHYPAHLNEFSEWVLASSLCSRCGATLPRSFSRNPPSISSKEYVGIMKQLLKRT